MILGVGGQLSGGEIADVLVCMRQTIDRLELEFSELAASFAAGEEWDEQGAVSAIGWLRRNCRMSAGAAADRVCVGEQLRALPASARAVSEGRIGFAHLALMARTQDALSAGGRALDEGQLLEKAEALTVAQFRDACHHARHAADAEAVAREEVDAVEVRFLEITRSDGFVFLRGMLDSVGGAELLTALEPLAEPSGDHDDRHRARRLADALVELASTGQRTHLQVTATIDTMLGRPGAPAADMELSLPISSRVVERLACDCNLTRVLLSAESLVIDVGRSMRVVGGSRRRALDARDKHCRWPGCDRPPSRSAAHHLVHWMHGGTTDLDNQVLLCHHHHWLVHEGRWQLVKREDGSLLAIPPPYAVDTG